MEASQVLKSHTVSIGGHFLEYSDVRCVAIIPVPGGRTQTITCEEILNDLYSRRLLRFSSKICPAIAAHDYQMLLEQTAFFNYCRFAIRDGFIEVEALADPATGDPLIWKEMITEVANLADQFELKLAGNDTN